jgi:hypothetical protein
MSKSVSHSASTLDVYHLSDWWTLGWYRVLGLIRHVIQILTCNIQYVSVRVDDHRFVLVRRVWRYQRANQNPYIVLVSKKNRQHNGQRKSTKGQTTIYKTSVKSFANIDRPNRSMFIFFKKWPLWAGFRID